jgi:branched-chain amino acid transport system ATP-binding protein
VTLTILSASGLAAGYRGVPVVHDLDIEVRKGEVVALLGPNGAGKTTTLRTLAGALRPIRGTVRCLDATSWIRLDHAARRGLSYITEERSVFCTLNVLENMRVARVQSDRVFSDFPELRERAGTRVSQLSGGEQQMLSVGLALARNPGLLIADEISLGLAPKIIQRLLTQLKAAAVDRQCGVLLVEQQVATALAHSDRAYVMRQGRVVLSGASSELLSDRRALADAYMGEPQMDPNDSVAYAGTEL